jgi:hypothetical protein
LATTEVARIGREAGALIGPEAGVRLRRVARSQKRTFLERQRLTGADLTGDQAAYLEAWARAIAKVQVIDHWVAENGLLTPDGTQTRAMDGYVALLNSAVRSMARLEASLRATERVRDPSMVVLMQAEARRLDGQR